MDKKPYIRANLEVIFKARVKQSEIERILNSTQCKYVKMFDNDSLSYKDKKGRERYTNFYLVEVPPSEVQDYIDLFKERYGTYVKTVQVMKLRRKLPQWKR